MNFGLQIASPKLSTTLQQISAQELVDSAKKKGAAAVMKAPYIIISK